MLKGILMYGGEGMLILAAAVVLIHAYNKGITQLLLIIGSVIILFFIAQMIGLPPFLESLFMSIYFLYYFFTKYEKESKGFIIAMYLTGAILQMIGKIMT